jgi:hypothetical protein
MQHIAEILLKFALNTNQSINENIPLKKIITVIIHYHDMHSNKTLYLKCEELLL